jgi:glyoxylase-like metal-dependent hydrolase (beta-lactamase superfamily II)
MLLLCTQLAHADALLKVEKLAEGIFALVGSTGARLYENYGLNANYGVIDTPEGAILIDSGASTAAAKLLEAEARKLTGKPVRWVINTGSQDHRWLGNAYFAGQGAEIIALEVTAATQKRLGLGQIESLKPSLKEQVNGLQAMPASKPRGATSASLTLGGRTIALRYFADAHFPGDAVVWLPAEKILFSGDHIYVDRMLGILPESNSEAWLKAFDQAIAMQPEKIVPGHGRVCDVAKVQRDTGDYLRFVVAGVKKLAEDMAGVDAAVASLGSDNRFGYLENSADLHKGNVSRAYLRMESAQ